MKKLIAISLLLFCSMIGYAKGDVDSTKIIQEQLKLFMKFRDSVANAMKYETGVIQLKGGMAKLNVPKGFKYLGIEQSHYVIEDVWGNPKRDDILGMLFPENASPLGDSSYAFIISFEEMGYVKDGDADDIDYKEMLAQTQKEEPAENAIREKNGYPPIHMIGWAQPPFYDSKNKVLHWARELKFGDDELHTLNYDIRFLGRRGILSLNAVATIEDLEMVKADINKVLGVAEFTDGNRYADYNNSTDKIATYTVAGLVTGKVLAKIGFFAKFWKLILLGIAGIGAAIAKLFKKKKEPEFVYQPQQPEPPTNSRPDNV